MRTFLSLILLFILIGCKKTTDATAQKVASIKTTHLKETSIVVKPIQHATMLLQWGETTIYIDPVGGAKAFEGDSEPDLILITDIHGDHFSLSTLEELNTSNAKIMVPQAVANKIPDNFAPQIDVLTNGSEKERFGFNVTAIPMYNLREEALKFHTKGRGNGYVIEKAGKRVYISGDTEDIPEMRALQDIDIAFICMNLPYTMTVNKAAEAVLDFKPNKVYPYHYRGTDGLSDVTLFKSIINEANSDIEVIQLDWYSN